MHDEHFDEAVTLQIQQLENPRSVLCEAHLRDARGSRATVPDQLPSLTQLEPWRTAYADLLRLRLLLAEAAQAQAHADFGVAHVARTSTTLITAMPLRVQSRPLPALDCPLPPIALRLQERADRIDARRQRRARTLKKPGLGNLRIGAVAARIFTAAAGGGASYFLEGGTDGRQRGVYSGRVSSVHICSTGSASAVDSQNRIAPSGSCARSSRGGPKGKEGSVKRTSHFWFPLFGLGVPESPLPRPPSVSFLSTTHSSLDDAYTGRSNDSEACGAHSTSTTSTEDATSPFPQAPPDHTLEIALSQRRGSDNRDIPLASPSVCASSGNESGRDSPASHCSTSRNSILSEWERIDKGLAPPYMAYLFSPQVQIVDLNALNAGNSRHRLDTWLRVTCANGDVAEGGRQPTVAESHTLAPTIDRTLVLPAHAGSINGTLGRNPQPKGSGGFETVVEGECHTAPSHAPRQEARCVSFSPVGDCYIIGTSTGAMWYVPIGADNERTYTTYLGTLHHKHAASVFTAGHGGSSSPAASGAPMSGGGENIMLYPHELHGHTNAINFVAFNDDGSLFLSASSDRSIMLWKASTRTKLRRIASAGNRFAAPAAVQFVPSNNNYIIVSYEEDRQLRLYNASTGFPVAAGVAPGGGGRPPHAPPGKPATTPQAITALAADAAAQPFFFTGDAAGNITLWTYQAAGDIQASAPVMLSPAVESSKCGQPQGSRPLRERFLQPPELRPITTVALGVHWQAKLKWPTSRAVAKLAVCELTTQQARGLLRARHGPVEVASAHGRSTDDGQRANVQSHTYAKGSDPVKASPDSNFPSSALGTLSSYWSAVARNVAKFDRLAEHGLAGPAHAGRRPCPGGAPSYTVSDVVPARAKDAHDEVLMSLCPFLVLASLPCDSLMLLGVMVTSAEDKATSRGDGPHDGFPSNIIESHQWHKTLHTPCRYTMVCFMEINGLCRLRHLGTGAIFCRDNERLIVMASPCEEGFIRIVASTVAHVGGSSETEEATTRCTVLATLPIPCGGVCRDVAWSADCRFLVAVTSEGMVYQWERVYLLSGKPGLELPASATHSVGLSPQLMKTKGIVNLDAERCAGPSSISPASQDGSFYPHASGLPRLGRAMNSAALNTSSKRFAGAMQNTRLLEEEEEEWRQSLYRERERQKNERHLKVVNNYGTYEGSSSGYWLDELDGQSLMGTDLSVAL